MAQNTSINRDEEAARIFFESGLKTRNSDESLQVFAWIISGWLRIVYTRPDPNYESGYKLDIYNWLPLVKNTTFYLK